MNTLRLIKWSFLWVLLSHGWANALTNSAVDAQDSGQDNGQDKNFVNVRALDESDVAQYVVIDKDGRQGEMMFRLREDDEQWFIEAQTVQGDWQSVGCEQQCALTTSSPAEHERFLGKTIVASSMVACVDNQSIAFCRLSDENDTKRIYALIILTRQTPSIVQLQQVSAPKSQDGDDGDSA